MNTLVVPDVHFPYIDYQAIEGMINRVKKIRFDRIIFIGDFFDFQQVSHYDKKPDQKYDLQTDIDEGMQLFDYILEGIKKRREHDVFFIRGNHEERLEKFLIRHADALMDLRGLKIPTLLGLDRRKVKYVEDMIKLDNVLFMHGDKVRIKAGYTAHANIDKAGVNVCVGHTHRLALVWRTFYYETLFSIEAGSLCSNRMPYLKSIPDWQLGFAMILENEPMVIDLNK